MKKTFFQRVTLFVAAIIFVILLPGKSAQAKDFTLNLDDNFVWGNIAEKGSADFYTFTVKEPSWVQITYQGHSIVDSYFIVKNYDMTHEYYGNTWVYPSSEQSPITKDRWYAFEAGTYKIIIGGAGNCTGSYRLKGKAISFGNNETEPNNGFAQAMSMTENGLVKGLISLDDDSDFYCIKVNTKQKLNVFFVLSMYAVDYTVYDGDFKQIDHDGIWGGSEASPVTCDYEYVWDPGIYYIKISRSGGNYGTYTIKYKNAVLASSVSIAGKNNVSAGTSFTLSATVYPNNATNKEVSWSSGNSSIASVDQNGQVTTYSPGKTTITATAQDGSNATANYTIIVTPKKMNKPSLYMYRGKKKVRISYYTQSGVSGYQIQYGLKSNFKGAKTVKVSKTRSYKDITKLKKNKKYYFRVRSYIKTGGKTYYGAWSSKKAVKIR